MPAQKICIFISSPGDVTEERDKARRVIDELQRQYNELTLEPVLWEDLALPATASFQETIDVILKQQPIDIAVFVLWSRLGSPLASNITRPDGSQYKSGTEREFELMLAAFEQSENKRPVILAYTRDDEEGFRKQFEKAADDDLRKLIDQRDLAKSFIQQQFHDADGRNIRAYHSFPEPTAFVQLLKTHLRSVLNEIVRVENLPRWDKPPYRSLNTFDLEHAQIFHGREEETFEVLQKLRDQERSGKAFVAIIGASGAGKSSLAMAGVAASLQNTFDDSTKEWKVARFIPSLSDGDLFLYLTKTIAAEIPNVASSSGSLDKIAGGLAKDPELTTELIIIPAMSAASEAAGGTIRLLVVLDQLEELWTDRNVSGEQRSNSLLRSRHWLSADRSHFWRRYGPTSIHKLNESLRFSVSRKARGNSIWSHLERLHCTA